jgi:Beta/Gamma crystallin
MSKVIVVLAALLAGVGLMGAPLAGAGEAMPGAGPGPQIIAFDNEEFLGDHIHLFGNMKDLGKWGNSISSMVILSGTWEFFDDEDFTGTSMGKLGPGMYADVTKHGLKNNSISSVRLASPGGGAKP